MMRPRQLQQPRRPATRGAPPPALSPPSRPRRPSLATHASQQQEEQPDALYELVARNQSTIRSLPIWAGAAGFASLLANRALSGVAPVVDAGSAQSRADVLGILMSAALLLSGLQWLSLRGREPEAVLLDGSRVEWVDPSMRLPAAAEREMRWAWRALSGTARCSSLTILLRGGGTVAAAAHFGALAAGVRPGEAARAGPVVEEALAKGQGQYLANLVLYPGRGEFVAYLPEATQGVAVQPFGGGSGGKGGGEASGSGGGGAIGCVVVGSDTVRGLSRLDQAWLATLADKLEVSLEGWRPGGDGFGG
jgi:hypothetical protein